MTASILNRSEAALNPLPSKVGVIVVNWNGRRFLADCLTSVTRTDYPPERLRLILVDNASTDGSADWAEQHFRSIEVIRNNANLGFAAGNNLGIKRAMAAGAEFVVVLNYDTVVEPNWLNELVQAAGSDNSIGSVQSLVLLHDEPGLVNTSGNQLHYLGFGFCGQYRSDRNEVSGQIKEIAYASGTAVLYRTAALQAVGLFDEDLFMYHEDLDLGWRLRLAGYLNVLAPRSVVYHKYSFSRNPGKFFWMERNRQIVLLKNCRLRTLWLIGLPWLIMELGLPGYALINGWFGWKIKSTWAAWACVFSTLKKRRQIQTLRRSADRSISRVMTTRIEFEGIDNPILNRLVNPLLAVYWQLIKWLIW